MSFGAYIVKNIGMLLAYGVAVLVAVRVDPWYMPITILAVYIIGQMRIVLGATASYYTRSSTVEDGVRLLLAKKREGRVPRVFLPWNTPLWKVRKELTRRRSESEVGLTVITTSVIFSLPAILVTRGLRPYSLTGKRGVAKHVVSSALPYWALLVTLAGPSRLPWDPFTGMGPFNAYKLVLGIAVVGVILGIIAYLRRMSNPGLTGTWELYRKAAIAAPSMEEIACGWLLPLSYATLASMIGIPLWVGYGVGVGLAVWVFILTHLVEGSPPAIYFALSRLVLSVVACFFGIGLSAILHAGMNLLIVIPLWMKGRQYVRTWTSRRRKTGKKQVWGRRLPPPR